MRGLVVSLILGLAASSSAQERPLPDENLVVSLEPQIKRLADVYAAVEENAAEPLDPKTVFFQGAIPSMLRTLDPHSSFFDPEQFQQLQQLQQSEQKGFGTVVSVMPGRVIILQTIDGTASAKAGLAAGDEILGVNGYDIRRLDGDQIIGLLGEARQHDVALDVLKPGPMLHHYTLHPELVDTPSVDRVFEVAPGVGHLRITAFEEATGKLMLESIERLGGASLKGLVIDLRDNPGGAVQAAIEAATAFLKPGQLIFAIKGRASKPEEVRTPDTTSPFVFPVVILINARSASASEIFAGALQDHDRAIVIGEPTYGKGLVQQVLPLTGGSGMALTTAFYYTPSGRSIQKPLSGGQLDDATSRNKGVYKTDSGREVRGGGGIQPDEGAQYPIGSRLREVLDASGALISFATEYLGDHSVTAEFEVDGVVLDRLKVWLAERQIQPGVSEWTADREWIQSRVQQEIVTQKFGVAAGDRIEAQRDPVVRQAVKRLSK